MTTDILPMVALPGRCPKCYTDDAYLGGVCSVCGFQDAEPILEEVREAGRRMAAALMRASEAGMGPAVILPELMKVLRESGIELDLGSIRQLLPF